MSGLTPSETIVMDLWDEGLGSADIAQRSAMSEKRVVRIVSTYSDRPFERRHPELMRQGSAQLLAALQSAGFAPATAPSAR